MSDDNAFAIDLKIYLYNRDNAQALNILKQMSREEKLYFDRCHLSFVHYICCNDGSVNDEIWNQFADVLPELLEASLSKISYHPLIISIYKDNPMIISKLSNYVQDKQSMSNSLNPLALAIQLRRYKALKALLDNGWFLEKDEEYMSALLYKCCNNEDSKSFALMLDAFFKHGYDLTHYSRFLNIFIKKEIIDNLEEEISTINNIHLSKVFVNLTNLLRDKKNNKKSKKELNLFFNVYLLLMAISFLFGLSKLIDLFVNIRT